MINYIFLGSPYNNSWVEVTKKLFKNKIADPVIWFGHDRHYLDAKKIFGERAIEDFQLRHRPHNMVDTKYSGENNEFFNSINYLRAKDTCLKLMDRLDIYGLFKRTDREVYFHQLCIFFLKKIEETDPCILIAAEAPHDHPRYVIYEIARYLNIPCYKFNNWTLLPLLSFQNLNTGEFIKTNIDIKKEKKYKTFEQTLKHYIDSVKKESYEIEYMKNQRENRGFSKIIKKKTSVNFLNDSKHNLANFIRGIYNPINPHSLNLFTRWKILSKNKNILSKKLRLNVSIPNLNEKYVYFPLHFEPERSSTPDGGDYHDQFKALCIIRRLVPKEYKIYVKEHPSQLYFSQKGGRSRSPLIYNLIKNVESTYLIDSNYDSKQLILNSECVFTITGTVALESSILGKIAVSFGPAIWYKGCPNIINFSDKLTFEDIMSNKIKSPQSVLRFFMNQMKSYSIPGIMNYSQKMYFSKFDRSEFIALQEENIYNFLKGFFKIYNHKNG